MGTVVLFGVVPGVAPQSHPGSQGFLIEQVTDWRCTRREKRSLLGSEKMYMYSLIGCRRAPLLVLRWSMRRILSFG